MERVKLRIILVGYGTVGRSLTDLLKIQINKLRRTHGFYPRVVAVVDRGGAAISSEGLDLETLHRVKVEKGSVSFYPGVGVAGISALDVIREIDAEVVVETTPTNIVNGEPGMTHIKEALISGKNVVTTNKGPLALALPALMDLAEYNNVLIRFSGTVGGGTPVIDFAKECLNGEEIVSIRGVLNGTTNFILTEMEEKHVAMKQALSRAKELGYTEEDPSMDIKGIDSACKLVILANWVMGLRKKLEDVEIEGIENLTLKNVEERKRRGELIRLIGEARDEELSVKPLPLPKHDPLCVKGTLNAVTFQTKFSGEKTIVGPGAGGVETASAVIRDLIRVKAALMKR